MAKKVSPQLLIKVSMNTTLTEKRGHKEVGTSRIKDEMIIHATEEEFNLRLKKAVDILKGVKAPVKKKAPAKKK